MKRFHREQPMVEEVVLETIAQQNNVDYRGHKGGEGQISCLPVDTMEGLMVDKKNPEGFYAAPYVKEVVPPTTEETI